MKNRLKIIIAILIILVISLTTTISITKMVVYYKQNNSDVLYSKIKLSCNENGKFKVLILADVHANGMLPDDVKQNIKTLVDREKPQLVIFTGDNVLCGSINKLKESLDSMVGYIEELKIPWCHVYGNHDDEYGLSKETMQDIYESYDYCVSKCGDKDLYGVGNYVLPVYKYKSNKICSLVWCLDSGNYISSDINLSQEEREKLYPERPDSPYDYIHTDQVEWYKKTSEELEKRFNRKIPSLMAFHIPLQETYFAWENRELVEEWTGEKNENVCASVINSGLFDALLERKDVLAIVNGHDHINDFMVKYQGIKLCYSPNISTLTYHDKRMMGSRVFILDENNPNDVDTYVSYLFR